MTSTTEPDLVRTARVTGALYLVIFVCGLFSELAVRGSLVVRGDATATAGNILASQGLFRLGFFGDLLVVCSDAAVSVLFYVLLRPVSRSLALVAASFRLVQTAILGVNLLFHFGALFLAGSPDYLDVFEPAQIHALVLLLLDVHRHAYDLGLVFFGWHCLVLGYLLYVSRMVPRALGILMALASLTYLTGSSLLFAAPSLADSFAPAYAIPVLAELALASWLVVKGVRVAA